MPPTKMTSIQPVEGVFIPGVPAVEMQLPKGQAMRLVKTGAFELGGSSKMSEEKEAAGEAAVAALDAAQPTAEEAPEEAEEGAEEEAAEDDEENADEGGES